MSPRLAVIPVSSFWPWHALLLPVAPGGASFPVPIQRNSKPVRSSRSGPGQPQSRFDSANNFGAGMTIGMVAGAVFAWAVLLTALGGT
ncbi:MAG TPA: hypothetical protein VLB12_19005 [Gemmatimonadales bacterium]|nr:hypothetical protein [Gemmatimonadales bacterium]